MSIRKKAAQAARRQVHEVVKNYERDLYARLEHIRVAFRPKPRFLPPWAWTLLVKRVIDLDTVKKNNLAILPTASPDEETPEGGEQEAAASVTT